MCALTGTPNLNLYFPKLRQQDYGGYKYMPLSMNYTLFAKDGHPKSENVIMEMNNILFNGKELSLDFIPLAERMEGVHFTFI